MTTPFIPASHTLDPATSEKAHLWLQKASHPWRKARAKARTGCASAVWRQPGGRGTFCWPLLIDNVIYRNSETQTVNSSMYTTFSVFLYWVFTYTAIYTLVYQDNVYRIVHNLLYFFQEYIMCIISYSWTNIYLSGCENNIINHCINTYPVYNE